VRTMTAPTVVGWRRYLELALAGLRAMLDVAMMVVGVALVGLAATVVLGGLGIIDRELNLSTAATLGSGLVIAVIGAFGLGITSEGSMRAAYRLVTFEPVEALVARVGGAIVVGLALVIGAGRAEPLVAELTMPLREALEVVRAVGQAGLVTAFVGAPAAWLIDWRGWSRRWPGLETVPVFVVWAFATMLLFTP